MNIFQTAIVPVIVTNLWLSGMLRAAEPSTTPATKSRPFMALAAEQAGPDFAVQGEYRGTFLDAAGKPQNLGVQVVALGDGKFKASFLPGGLPGDGWDGATATEVEGQTQADGTIFKVDGPAYRAVIANGILTGQTPQGEKFTLSKVLRTSPTVGLKAPEKAIVLFDGSNTGAWERGFIDARKLLVVNIPAAEQDPQGFARGLENASVGAGPITKEKVGDFSFHLEFMIPFKPNSRGQARGNSGIYIQQRYEVQVLDSFGFKLLDTKPTGDICGEIYRQQVPKLNMCFPPLSWQTYDIDFQQARWNADGRKLQNAVISVRLNGVVIYDNYAITAKTGQGKAEGVEPGPILLQGHGEPVVYRNIWIVPK